MERKLLLSDAITRLERLRERRLLRAAEKRLAADAIAERIKELDGAKHWQKANVYADMMNDALRSERSCTEDAEALARVLEFVTAPEAQERLMNAGRP